MVFRKIIFVIGAPINPIQGGMSIFAAVKMDTLKSMETVLQKMEAFLAMTIHHLVL